MMNEYTKLAEEFDGWAANNRAESMANGHWDVTMQMIENLELETVSRMVDVGCGNGWLVRELINRGASYGIGVDISPGMIQEAQRQILHASKEEYLVGNGESLPFEDASVDCITNIESLYYYPKPELALKEWARISKKVRNLRL